MQVLTVVAMMSVESIFYTPSHQKEEADRARSVLTALEGDHLTYLQVCVHVHVLVSMHVRKFMNVFV